MQALKLPSGYSLFTKITLIDLTDEAKYNKYDDPRIRYSLHHGGSTYIICIFSSDVFSILNLDTQKFMHFYLPAGNEFFEHMYTFSDRSKNMTQSEAYAVLDEKISKLADFKHMCLLAEYLNVTDKKDLVTADIMKSLQAINNLVTKQENYQDKIEELEKQLFS